MSKNNKAKISKLIKELQSALNENVYIDTRIPDEVKIAAHLGRISGLQLAILKIQLEFNIL